MVWRMIRNGWRYALRFGLAGMAALSALNAAGAKASLSDDDHFHAGRFEGSLGEGFLFSPALGANRPTLDYLMTQVRVGYMLTDIHGPNVWRGNLEVVGELSGSGVTHGRGNYIASATFWLRYNFVMPGSRFVPFLQGGSGLTETDLDRRIQGHSFNFNLNLAAGIRYLLTPDWSLNLECRYQHISNAHLAMPNTGIDGIGPSFSVSYFF